MARIISTILLTVILLAAAPVAAQKPLVHKLEITGVKDPLRARLRSISALADPKAAPATSYGMLAARIETDIKGFERLLRSIGYYDPRISHRISSEQGPTVIIIVVDPGPLYLIAEIDIAVIDRQDDEDLIALMRAGLGLAPEDAVIASHVIAAETALLALLPRHGHPFSRALARRVVIDHDSRTARVLFRYMAGPETRFGPLRIEGAHSVEAGFPARLVPWQQGDLYDQELVETFRNRLVATRLFQRVAVTPDLPADAGGAPDGAYPILVELAESSHRTISGGAGFATSEGIGGELQWEHRNILGAGERLLLTMRAAEIEQSLTARFVKPHFRRLDQELVLSSAAKREDTDAFDSLGIEARAGIDRHIGERWLLGIATEFAFSSIEEADERRDFLLASLPIAASYDSRDDLLDPQRGFYARASTAPYIAFQDGSFDFYRHILEGSWYRHIGGQSDIVLAARVGIGVLHGAPLARLPANRRFFAGGGGSVRGFDFQNVGPLDETGSPTGGRSRLEGALELRMRVFGNFALVPFLDVGQVWEESLPQFDGLRYGAGLGFRWHTDFAPIRIDIATPLDRRTGEDRVQIYIGIGQSF